MVKFHGHRTIFSPSSHCACNHFCDCRIFYFPSKQIPQSLLYISGNNSLFLYCRKFLSISWRKTLKTTLFIGTAEPFKKSFPLNENYELTFLEPIVNSADGQIWKSFKPIPDPPFFYRRKNLHARARIGIFLQSRKVLNFYISLIIWLKKKVICTLPAAISFKTS